MTRSVTIDANGNFRVSDDPHGIIALALLIATTPQNMPRIAQELSPGGTGLHVHGIGSIDRIEAREELPAPFDDDPAFDPETQELWRLFREPDHEHRTSGRFVISGDELRTLVATALRLRGVQ